MKKTIKGIKACGPLTNWDVSCRKTWSFLQTTWSSNSHQVLGHFQTSCRGCL